MSQKMLSSFWTGVSLHVYLDCVVEVGDVDIQSYNDAQWCFFSNMMIENIQVYQNNTIYLQMKSWNANSTTPGFIIEPNSG